jgi:hypothetical protein
MAATTHAVSSCSVGQHVQRRLCQSRMLSVGQDDVKLSTFKQPTRRGGLRSCVSILVMSIAPYYEWGLPRDSVEGETHTSFAKVAQYAQWMPRKPVIQSLKRPITNSLHKKKDQFNSVSMC